MILGIVATVAFWVPIVNIGSMILAIIGGVLGLFALVGTRKGLAVGGVLLCAFALIASIVVTAVFVKRVDGSVGQGTVSDGSAAVPAPPMPPQQKSVTATWGQRYTFDDGLAVEVAAPQECTLSRSAHPQTVKRAVLVQVKVVNGTGKPFETAGLGFGHEAQFAGAKAEPVFDIGGGCNATQFSSATVLPGKEYTYTVAYGVGEAPGELQLVFEPRLLGDKAIFVGQA